MPSHFEQHFKQMSLETSRNLTDPKWLEMAKINPRVRTTNPPSTGLWKRLSVRRKGSIALTDDMTEATARATVRNGGPPDSH